MSKEFPKEYTTKEIEQKWKKHWQESGIYEFTYDSAKPTYVVDTPPPYVNADHLHSGHIMSYTQAEFVVRFKRMQGFNIFYPMGFDDNGYPTERFVEKKYNIDKNTISKKEFVELCLEETRKGAENYKKLWTDLGISVDWNLTYSTIHPTAIKVSQWSLQDLYKKGALYRATAPILWAVESETALAQTDLDDVLLTTKLNYIHFKSEEGQNLTIATTRPELLPACVALYVNPTDERYKQLIGQKAIVPIFNHEVEIRSSEEVDIEFGSGFMMVCTWGDQEDVKKWMRDKLDTREVLLPNGKLNELAGKYAGQEIEEARENIIADLKTAGLLEKQEDLEHSVKVNDRTGVPINFVMSRQWFIKITDMADTWIKMGEKLRWFPQDRFNDYKQWVESVKWDWCVSRQRYYGVPFPIWYCKACDEPHFVDESLLPHDPSFDPCPFEKCEKCGGTEFIPETDVLDTWATSSCTPFLLRELIDDEGIKQKLFPVTLRPNAFEIIRTWDFYSIVKAYYNFNSKPFDDVMISGHGLDSQGRKISKRLGNYIPSEELVDTYGADAIRYWATGAILGNNLRFSESELANGKKLVTKLWNVAKLLDMHANENQYDDLSEYTLEAADEWILDGVGRTLTVVTDSLENYDYSRAKRELESFFWGSFTDYYLEFIKYRLYGEDLRSKEVAVATALHVFEAIMKMFAPMMPFVAEEISHNLFKLDESIHTSGWPQVKAIDAPADFAQAMLAIDEIRKFKTDSGYSLGKEIEEYTLKTPINVEKYREFLQKVGRIQTLVV